MWLEEVDNNRISRGEYCVATDLRRNLGKFRTEELLQFNRHATRKFYLRGSYIIKQIYQAFVRRNFRLLSSGLRLIGSF